MLGVLYSVVSYVLFLAVFVYFAFFGAGVAVPKHVDSGWLGDPAVAATIDTALILLFGLQHSIMARAPFKAHLTRLVPPSLERATYVMASNLVLAFAMWQWRPLPRELWNVSQPVVATALWALCAIGWLGVPTASFFIDHFGLFGLRQALAGFRRRTFKSQGFLAPYLYRYVRHPMMSFLLLGLWVTPYMTAGHLLLAGGMTVYILIGVHFEERSLARELGAEYVQYQATTPRFLPGTPSPEQHAEPAR